MAERTFYASLHRAWGDGRYVCVGLDPDNVLIPDCIVGTVERRIGEFCRTIVDATESVASAFKINSAFFEQYGVPGARLLEELIAYIKDRQPDRLVILDAKRGDIDNTNRYYARAVFDVLGADVVTVHPYMGYESLRPFLERADKGVIVMAANSTPGAEEFQGLMVGEPPRAMYEHIGRTVAENWNRAANCSVTAGATEPDKLARLRATVADMPILLLGLGAQGGDLDECLRVGRARRNFGLIPNSSRAILYASSGRDFADAATDAARSFNRRLSGA
ncbi:orotidine-5'-phosphate decarboxylase [Cumulibacter soli]|uniref:orotidine-5'-phosphate decarboxylase n=1 Tax=Cumulibacter soli TaxID=2546344 RepID=UPI00141A0E0C|nr:orotidine-5'-phosphate decarboxylase [Cumulibacter soli]